MADTQVLRFREPPPPPSPGHIPSSSAVAAGVPAGPPVRRGKGAGRPPPATQTDLLNQHCTPTRSSGKKVVAAKNATSFDRPSAALFGDGSHCEKPSKRTGYTHVTESASTRQARRHIDAKGRLTPTPEHIACMKTFPVTTSDPILQRNPDGTSEALHTGRGMVKPACETATRWGSVMISPKAQAEAPTIGKRRTQTNTHRSDPYLLRTVPSDVNRAEAQEKHSSLGLQQRHAFSGSYGAGRQFHEVSNLEARHSSKRIDPEKKYASHPDVINSDYAPVTERAYDPKSVLHGRPQQGHVGEESCHLARQYKTRDHSSALALSDHLYDVPVDCRPSDLDQMAPLERVVGDEE